MKTTCLWMTLLIVITSHAMAQREPGPGRGAEAQRQARDRIEEKAPLAHTDREKQILKVLEDVDRNQRAGSMSVPVLDGRLLRLLTEATGATNVVEIGTSVGYSGLWFCLALETTDGHLTTFDIDEDRAAQAMANFKRAGVQDRVTLVLGNAHETVGRLKEPIDILFLDADKQGYLDYLNKLLPLVRPGGLILAHNMNPRMADPRFVEAVTTDPGLETLFLNRELTGIGVTLKKR